ncbi:MAG: GNAT family N-acetyltransferase [Ruminococcus sp.]|nr:GNAT family N-acetyltransferase [Ruminococcus sp.]
MKSNFGLKYVPLNKYNLDIAVEIQKSTWPDDPDYEDLYDKATNTRDDNAFFLIYNKDLLIGLTGVDVEEEYPDTIWLDWFTILPEYRGLSFGTKALIDTIEYCHSLNRFKSFRIDTTYYENVSALLLYNKIMKLKENYTLEDTKLDKSQTVIYSYPLDGPLEPWDNKNLNLKEYYDKLGSD